MKLRTLFVINTLVALLFALALLLGPDVVLKFFGFTTSAEDLFLGRLIGAALIGTGILTWFARDFSDAQSLQGVVLSLFLYGAIGFVVSLLGVLAPVTHSGTAWLVVIIFLFFAAGYAYFQFMGPRE